MRRFAAAIILAFTLAFAAGGAPASAHAGYWQCDPYNGCWYVSHASYHGYCSWATWDPSCG